MSFEIKRLGLIISPTIQSNVSSNINGPCCIKLPDWCDNRLGTFYLYFSDHLGDSIKLAYSEHIVGPWSIFEGGVLNLSKYKDAYDHVASPDIFIDHQNERLILYFHARAKSKGREQWTFAAISQNGTDFLKIIDKPLAPFYLRVIFFEGYFYGISKGGNIWRSIDGLTKFEPGGNIFDEDSVKDLWKNEPGSIRHVALSRKEKNLHIFYSKIGDAPERILKGNVSLNNCDWINWKMENEKEVLKPETLFEGAALPLINSRSGPSLRPENGLRDPYILQHESKNYLFYTVSGEQGIAVCELGSLEP